MLEEKVLKTIKKFEQIQSGDTVIIGVSGGPDSICLLNILKNLQNQLGIKIVVAHINHKIREEADEETRYVEEFCKKIDVPCFVKYADIIKMAKENKCGTEEIGRAVRYEFFEEVLTKVNGNKIATAHNANDNAETVLMNIMRGSGLSGLKGIDRIRDNKFIRPIIECSRDEIEEYCREHKLDPRYDKTNEENTYTRNKIRNLLIPYIQENFNPNIIETLNRMSEILYADDIYFENNVKTAYENLLEEKDENQIVLNLKKFNDYEKVIKSRIILYTINNLRGTAKDIEKIHIEDIIKLCSNNIGNKFLIPNKNLKIMVKNKKIFFIRDIKLP